MHIIETCDLSHAYHDGTIALDYVNFIAKKGDVIALLGANGAGKSTLLKHFNGILTPTRGTILVKGKPITKSNVLEVRKTVGLVFQDPNDQIFAPTIIQDVAFGPMNLSLPKEVVERRVRDAIEIVGMTGYEDKAPHHLSSGQKKRIAIAGILAMEPEVIVLDEPTANLDSEGASMVMKMIHRFNRDLGMTIIVATHNVDDVPLFADKVVILSEGGVVADGLLRDVINEREIVERSGLKLPRVSQLFNSLEEEGFSFSAMPLTIGEAKRELLQILGT